MRSGKQKEKFKTKQQRSKNETVVSDDEDDLAEKIPGTPPNKKFKSIFFSALHNNSMNNTQLSQTVVLAEDSDPDSD